MIRHLFVDAAAAVRPLLVATVERWDEPSALAEFSVRGLAGHLVRAVTSVEAYLDAPPPHDEPVSPAVYYSTALADPRVDVGVRENGEAMAADGHSALLATYDASLDRLRTRVPAEPPDRKLAAFLGIVLTLDDYLVTRLTEIVVHADDLACSLDLPTPDLPTGPVISALVDVARYRHGDVAVLRALSRGERAEPGIFPVL